MDQQIVRLQEKLVQKNEVIAELMHAGRSGGLRPPLDPAG
jgi:hypothetical protein